jgi:hypothetical protein
MLVLTVGTGDIVYSFQPEIKIEDGEDQLNREQGQVPSSFDLDLCKRTFLGVVELIESMSEFHCETSL